MLDPVLWRDPTVTRSGRTRVSLLIGTGAIHLTDDGGFVVVGEAIGYHTGDGRGWPAQRALRLTEVLPEALRRRLPPCQ